MFLAAKIPLHHVGKDYFRRPFRIADKTLKVPSVKALLKDIDAIFIDNREQLAKVLSTVSHAAATADLWSSYRRSFVGSTVHWFDPDTLERKSDVLACQRITGHHYFDVIAGLLKQALDSVSARKIVKVITVDGGRNIRKALR